MRASTRAPRLGRAVLLASIVTAFVVGCGDGKDRVPLFPASGSVLVDGKPAPGVEIRLAPAGAIEDRNALRPFATTAEDGRFTLGTYDKEDGAPAGRYKVTLFWPDRPPGPGHPNDLLGGRYADAQRSPIEAVIAQDANALKPFEVKAADPTEHPPRNPTLHDNDFLE